MTFDPHSYKRHLENLMRRIRASPKLTREAKANLERFEDECHVRGLSPGRIIRYMHEARRFIIWNGGDLNGASLQDIKALVSRVQRSSYAPGTKRDMKVALKKYVQFLQGTEEVPDIVSWIRPATGVKTRKLPEELLTEQDVAKIIQASDNARDRAFIATLYESGCRIGEVLGLQVKHVSPADLGMQLRVDGKTGSRRVRVISSAPYLEWSAS